MESLERQVQQLEENMVHLHVTNPLISEGSVGWHIDHCLLVMISIISALKKSDINSYRWVFNWRRAWIFFTQKIPRGRVKAPKYVDPLHIDPLHVTDQHAKIAKVHQLLEEMKTLPSKTYFHHFIFGDLDLKDTHYFLRIHTHHHLKIMAELINGDAKTGQ
ncbi:hypothetical protein G9H61_05265 [Aquirufa ecclesiirivi]|uniref:DUF1569 domain-containing protein n=1 Tax=Aquirufa ecclesiirivi TaxID=2715124 RepID=A0ABT4JEZ1_9BACT|nr:hypothetical protein [Aquirufa ecclesiirivi]MCZ2474844.1 hypothetical protein [Aquirufa ecclesiirivi]